MSLLPIHLNIKGQPVLIVGGGEVALRKAHLLTQIGGACVDVVAPNITESLSALVGNSGGSCIYDVFKPQHLDAPYKLVVAATNDAAVNACVFAEGESRNVMVNAVDDLAHCRFVMPAIINRSPVTVSIGTQGTSPVLARQLRTQIEMLLPSDLGTVASFAGAMRSHVKTKLPSLTMRRRFWEWCIPKLQTVKLAALSKADWPIKLEELISQYQQKEQGTSVGEVYLVGAGPGDADLLTLKALRLMQQADVIVYDRLVSQPILDLCRRDADFVYVGKARSNHTVPQEQITQILVDLALQGKRVCRLKGGDPFIFGRGGEELAGIVEHNIAFQVVPGITAALGAASYAGIPLTHRDYAQSVRFLTGHQQEGKPELPWQELIYEQQTLVLYMGLVGLPHIRAQLLAHGMRATMPVALVSHATQPTQQVVIGTLDNIVEVVNSAKLSAPTIIIVGEVVQLHHQLGRV